MTQHTEMIERLRSAAWSGPVPCPVCDEAADALEAQAREIEGLRKDADRLDWLESSSESHGFCHTAYGEHRYYAHQIKGYPTVREVIDAAMKGQPCPKM